MLEQLNPLVQEQYDIAKQYQLILGLKELQVNVSRISSSLRKVLPIANVHVCIGIRRRRLPQYGVQRNIVQLQQDKTDVRGAAKEAILLVGYLSRPVRGHRQDKRLPQCAAENANAQADPQQL